MRIPHRLPNGKTTGTTNGGVGESPSDKIAIIAQKYAGYFIGHPYRFDQQTGYRVVTEPELGIHVQTKKWSEPAITRDDCEFCKRMTDESVESRVAGFQHQIDIEVIRGKTAHYNSWLWAAGPDVVDKRVDEQGNERGIVDSQANRRAFCRVEGEKTRTTVTGKDRPAGWERKALPLVDLPQRLKRKMVIEWNHVYRDYLRANPGVTYDFEHKQFFKEMPDLEPLTCCKGSQFYNTHEDVVKVHMDGCNEKPADLEPLGYAIGEHPFTGGY